MPSTERYPSLSRYVDKFFQQNLVKDEKGMLWNLVAMLSYALNLSSNSVSGAMIHDSLSRLDNMASSSTLDEDAADVFFKRVVCFIPDFKILFMFPKIQDWSDVVRFGPDFFNFLLLFLHVGTDSVSFLHKDHITLLHNGLRFLLSFLGDTPVQFTERHEVRELLMKIGTTAGTAGSLINGLFLDEKRESTVSDMGAYISTELERIEEIKDDIKELIHSESLSPFVKNQENAAVESLFIVDSFIRDLEDLMSFEADNLVDETRKIHELMISSIAVLRGLKLNVWQSDELKQLAVQMRDITYEAEYLIKSFANGDAFSTWYLSLRLTNVFQKMMFVKTTLEEIKMNYEFDGALKISNDVRESSSLRTADDSKLDDEIVVGFEEKETEILDQLVGGPQNLQIISICGMPGLGKTTLARTLYHHRSVKVHFDRRSWGVISQMYRRKKLLSEILINLDATFDEKKLLEVKEETIADIVYKTLKGRRYLIVMDDIWDSNLWNDIRRYFPNDGNGSRIIFTSRIVDAVPKDSVAIHKLSLLSEDQCWELLAKKVFPKDPFPPQLEAIGRQIASNCGGLPLAVVVTAGTLAAMGTDESVWGEVKGSLDSYLFSDSGNCMKILELSYRHLPDHLKPCFLYFGMFPEDTNVVVSDLFARWNAEGFVCRRKQEKRPEIVAREYLMELVDRSLVQVVEMGSIGRVKKCSIHDLLHELCLRIAEENNFMKLIGEVTKDSTYEKQRLCLDENSPMPFGPHVRSISGRYLYTPFSLQNMKLLRLLNGSSDEGPGCIIDSLSQVRYLRASRCSATSMVNFTHLEYLIIAEAPTPFPPFLLLKMPKLRYIRFENGIQFERDINISSTAQNLEHLSYVYIETLKDEEILKRCPNLRKLKCVCGPVPFLDNEGEEHYRYPDLSFLTQLESLNMSFFNFWDRVLSIDIRFPHNIKKLILSDQFRLPWESMSVIIGKLPKLMVLKLKCDAFEGEKWETNDDEFQELRFLELFWMDLEKWEVASSEHFPRLQTLVLFECEKLEEIPSEIGDIPTMEKIHVIRCNESAMESAMRIKEEQEDMGNEDLEVIIVQRDPDQE